MVGLGGSFHFPGMEAMEFAMQICVEIAGQSALINMETCSMPGTMVLYSTLGAVWKPEKCSQSTDFVDLRQSDLEDFDA